jgi:hypothetical protein
MSIIPTDKGDINTRYVVRMEVVGRRDKRQTHVIFMEGDELHSAYTDVNDPSELLEPIVKSDPGWHVVCCFESEPFDTYTVPIIAWRISIAGCAIAHPICPDRLSGNFEWGILCPDGTVLVPFEARYESRESFRAFCVERYREEQKQQTEMQNQLAAQ